MFGDWKRRRKILDAVSETLTLNEEIGLEVDQLADLRERLLERATNLLNSYEGIWPTPMSDFTDIGPECFASGDGLVISYKGENYYKACGALVEPVRAPEGGSTSCVKRVNHPGNIHEDWHGNTREYSPGLNGPNLEEAVTEKSGE